ncbi:unnamed protein product [Trichobilharzia regenti]|nr:unnamed protein product [Trichobilharzia regenti]
MDSSMDVTACELEQIVNRIFVNFSSGLIAKKYFHLQGGNANFGKRKTDHTSRGTKKRPKILKADSESVEATSTTTTNTEVSPPECKVEANDTKSLSLLKEIQSILELRNQCTVKIHGLPAKTSITELETLVPGAKAYRLPWINYLHRCHGFAYIEFESEEDAVMHKERLNNQPYGDRALKASIGKFISECVEILVNNDKRRPGTAHLTFASEEDAVNALKSRHGCSLRGRKTSVLFHMKTSKTSKNCLVVRGLSKNVSENDVLAVFPQASTANINRFRGEAQLMYDLEEDCLLDQKQAKNVVIGGHKVEVIAVSVNKQSVSHPTPNVTKHTDSNVERNVSSGIVIDRCTLPLSEESVRELFPDAINICVPTQLGTQNGVAYVEFASLSQAERAVRSADSKTMRVRMANPKRLKFLGITKKFTLKQKNQQNVSSFPSPSTKMKHDKVGNYSEDVVGKSDKQYDQKVKKKRNKNKKLKSHFLPKHVT